MTLTRNLTFGEDTTHSTQIIPIELARAYVRDLVQIPALASALPEAIKSKIRHSDLWLEKFKRVGDLVIYLQRFESGIDDPIYKEMKKFGLLTFEDIVGDFSNKFGQWASDCSRITDFVVGEVYSVYEILILARNYDTRSGGMFVIEADRRPAAVIIKATLADGPYPNEWLDEPRILKYYLKSISGVFGEHFKPNRAIIENRDIPVVTFTRSSHVGPFVFQGIFCYKNILRELDGSKAFVLTKSISEKQKMYSDLTYVEKNLKHAVSISVKDAQDLRLHRLAMAAKYPKRITVTSTAFDRNPDVIAEVLYRAAGVCELCRKPAPFLRLSDGTAYLEVHHRNPLSAGGADTVENAIALCPNCHRRSHYGPKETGEFQHHIDRDDLAETV
jgi:5-methylcytosine-specific restriction protein A